MLAMSVAAVAWAGPVEEAAALFRDGEALLAQGDFEGAAKAFQGSARLDPRNDTYRSEYILLWRINSLRAGLKTTTELPRWLATAGQLRAYYYDHKLLSEALTLDRERHARQPGAESAVLLAETQLQLGLDHEAEGALAALKAEETTPRARVLLGIALARQARLEDARKLAAAVALAAEDDAQLAFDLARLRALVEDRPGAAAALVTCLERTLPSRLEVTRSQVAQCPDFDSMRAGTEFAQALRTESKVPESKCSTGTSCGKCPSRSACAQGDKPRP